MTGKERLQDAMIKLFADYQTSFYGAFLLQFYCVPSKPQICDTFAVTLTNKGVVMLYNPFFVDTLNEATLEFVLIHEMMHVVYDHVKQHPYYGDLELANIAQDAVINADIIELGFKMPKIRDSYKEMQKMLPFKLSDNYVNYIIESTVKKALKDNQITKDEVDKVKAKIISQAMAQGISPLATMEDMGGQNSGIEFEPNYKGSKLSFEYYLYLLEKKKQQQSNGSEGSKECDSKGNAGKNTSKGKGRSSNSGGITHSHSDISAEDLKEAVKGTDLEGALQVEEYELGKSMVNTMLEAAKQKARGSVPGAFEALVEGLKKTKKNYLKQILQGVTFVSGSVKQETYKRESRRGIDGLKGNKKYARKINVILDTSGSMYGEFDKCLSILFSRGITCNLIQVDTQVQSVEEVNSDYALRRVAIKGMGGTYLTPAIEYIQKNPKLSMYNTVIMTDGYTETLDCSKLKRTLVLTTEAIPEVLGNTRVVKIEKEN